MSVRVVTRVQDMKTAHARVTGLLSRQYGPVKSWSARDKQHKLLEVVRVQPDGSTVVVAKDQRLFDVLHAADQTSARRRAEDLAAASARGQPPNGAYVDALSGATGQAGSGAAALVSRRFVVDRAFPASLSHGDLYARSIQSLVRSAFDGGKFCLLLYGAPKSGKTYTLLGTEPVTALAQQPQQQQQQHAAASAAAMDAVAGAHVGLLPRSLFDLFTLAKQNSNATRAYQLRVSVLRVQNELVFDALAATSPTTGLPQQQQQQAVALRVHDDDNGAVPPALAHGSSGAVYRPEHTHVVGAMSLRVNGVRDIATVVDACRRVRASGSGSSASGSSPLAHAVVSVVLEQISLTNHTAGPATAASVGVPPPDQWTKVVVSKMQFVECAARDAHPPPPTPRGGAAASASDQQYQKCMKSLNALETVLGALSSRLQPAATPVSTSTAHIPYRNSKLTHCLKDTLSPWSDVIVWTCVSPISHEFVANVATLRFAARIRTFADAPAATLAAAAAAAAATAAGAAAVAASGAATANAMATARAIAPPPASAESAAAAGPSAIAGDEAATPVPESHPTPVALRPASPQPVQALQQQQQQQPPLAPRSPRLLTAPTTPATGRGHRMGSTPRSSTTSVASMSSVSRMVDADAVRLDSALSVVQQQQPPNGVTALSLPLPSPSSAHGAPTLSALAAAPGSSLRDIPVYVPLSHFHRYETLNAERVARVRARAQAAADYRRATAVATAVAAPSSSSKAAVAVGGPAATPSSSAAVVTGPVVRDVADEAAFVAQYDAALVAAAASAASAAAAAASTAFDAAAKMMAAGKRKPPSQAGSAVAVVAPDRSGGTSAPAATATAAPTNNAAVSAATPVVAGASSAGVAPAASTTASAAIAAPPTAVTAGSAATTAAPTPTAGGVATNASTSVPMAVRAEVDDEPDADNDEGEWVDDEPPVAAAGTDTAAQINAALVTAAAPQPIVVAAAQPVTTGTSHMTGVAPPATVTDQQQQQQQQVTAATVRAALTFATSSASSSSAVAEINNGASSAPAPALAAENKATGSSKHSSAVRAADVGRVHPPFTMLTPPRDDEVRPPLAGPAATDVKHSRVASDGVAASNGQRKMSRRRQRSEAAAAAASWGLPSPTLRDALPVATAAAAAAAVPSGYDDGANPPTTKGQAYFAKLSHALHTRAVFQPLPDTHELADPTAFVAAHLPAPDTFLFPPPLSYHGDDVAGTARIPDGATEASVGAYADDDGRGVADAPRHPGAKRLSRLPKRLFDVIEVLRSPTLNERQFQHWTRQKDTLVTHLNREVTRLYEDYTRLYQAYATSLGYTTRLHTHASATHTELRGWLSDASSVLAMLDDELSSEIGARLVAERQVAVLAAENHQLRARMAEATRTRRARRQASRSTLAELAEVGLARPATAAATTAATAPSFASTAPAGSLAAATAVAASATAPAPSAAADDEAVTPAMIRSLALSLTAPFAAASVVGASASTSTTTAWPPPPPSKSASAVAAPIAAAPVPVVAPAPVATARPTTAPAAVPTTQRLSAEDDASVEAAAAAAATATSAGTNDDDDTNDDAAANPDGPASDDAGDGEHERADAANGNGDAASAAGTSVTGTAGPTTTTTTAAVAASDDETLLQRLSRLLRSGQLTASEYKQLFSLLRDASVRAEVDGYHRSSAFAGVARDYEFLLALSELLPAKTLDWLDASDHNAAAADTEADTPAAEADADGDADPATADADAVDGDGDADADGDGENAGADPSADDDANATAAPSVAEAAVAAANERGAAAAKTGRPEADEKARSAGAADTKHASASAITAAASSPTASAPAVTRDELDRPARSARSTDPVAAVFQQSFGTPSGAAKAAAGLTSPPPHATVATGAGVSTPAPAPSASAMIPAPEPEDSKQQQQQQQQLAKAVADALAGPASPSALLSDRERIGAVYRHALTALRGPLPATALFDALSAHAAAAAAAAPAPTPGGTAVVTTSATSSAASAVVATAAAAASSSSFVSFDKSSGGVATALTAVGAMVPATPVPAAVPSDGPARAQPSQPLLAVAAPQPQQQQQPGEWRGEFFRTPAQFGALSSSGASSARLMRVAEDDELALQRQAAAPAPQQVHALQAIDGQLQSAWREGQKLRQTFADAQAWQARLATIRAQLDASATTTAAAPVSSTPAAH